MREANARGEALGLTDPKFAFYDALKTNVGEHRTILLWRHPVLRTW